MKFTRSLIVSAVFVLMALGVAIWLYPRLPTQVPSHWDMAGNVNGYMPRFWAAAFPALMVAVLALLTWLLPVISPKRFRIGPFANVYVGLMLVIQAFMLVTGIIMLLAGAGFNVAVPMVAMLGVGTLLVVLGNYMGKLRRNFFIGIRTPWTIASEATWERTHRLAGPLFVVAGIVVLVTAALGSAPWIGLVCIGVAALVPVVYSYLVYRRLEGPLHD